MSEVVSRLGRRGLLDKVRDPQDGRRFLLRLTDDGARTHRRLTVRTARMNQMFLAPLSAREQEAAYPFARCISWGILEACPARAGIASPRHRITNLEIEAGHPS